MRVQSPLKDSQKLSNVHMINKLKGTFFNYKNLISPTKAMIIRKWMLDNYHSSYFYCFLVISCSSNLLEINVKSFDSQYSYFSSSHSASRGTTIDLNLNLSSLFIYFDKNEHWVCVSSYNLSSISINAPHNSVGRADLQQKIKHTQGPYILTSNFSMVDNIVDRSHWLRHIFQDREASRLMSLYLSSSDGGLSRPLFI